MVATATTLGTEIARRINRLAAVETSAEETGATIRSIAVALPIGTAQLRTGSAAPRAEIP
jgi:hypothetical protein